MNRNYTQDEIDRDVPEMDREFRDHHRRQMADIELDPEEIDRFEDQFVDEDDDVPDHWDYLDQLDDIKWEEQSPPVEDKVA